MFLLPFILFAVKHALATEVISHDVEAFAKPVL